MLEERARVDSIVIFEKIESPPQARQHAETQDIDLEDFQNIEIILVPLDHLAVFHRGVLDRDDLVEVCFRNDEAADMLGKMARKPVKLFSQRQGLIETRIGGVEAGANGLFSCHAIHRPAPD